MILMSNLAADSERSERLRAIAYLRKLGATIPTKLEDAFEALNAVLRVNFTSSPVPDPYSITPDNAHEIAGEYVADLSRRSAAEDGLSAVRGAMDVRVIDTCLAARDELLADPAIRSEFQAGTDVYEKYYDETLAEVFSPADAMNADETGAALVAFRALVAATKRLDTLTDALIDLTAPRPTEIRATRMKLSASRTLALTASPPANSAAYLAALHASGVDGGRPAKSHPYGVYGAQVNGGAVLGLPRDAADWSARTDSFNLEAARVDLFFPELSA